MLPHLQPFHESVLDEMFQVNRKARNAHARAIAIARLLARTRFPHVKPVQADFHDMVRRLGGIKSKHFSRLDRGAIKRAVNALAKAVAEEAKEQHPATAALEEGQFVQGHA